MVSARGRSQSSAVHVERVSEVDGALHRTLQDKCDPPRPCETSESAATLRCESAEIMTNSRA